MSQPSKLEHLRTLIAENEKIGHVDERADKEYAIDLPDHYNQAFISIFIAPVVPTTNIDELVKLLESINDPIFEAHYTQTRKWSNNTVETGSLDMSETIAKRTRIINASYDDIADDDARAYLGLSSGDSTEEQIITDRIYRRIVVKVLPHPVLIELAREFDSIKEKSEQPANWGKQKELMKPLREKLAPLGLVGLHTGTLSFTNDPDDWKLIEEFVANDAKAKAKKK